MALQLIPLGAPAVDTYTPLAQLGQTFFRQYDDARKRKFEDDFAKSNADLIDGMSPAASAPMPQGGTLGEMGKPSRALPTMAAGQGDIGQYAQSIKAIESGGKYGIVGPTHPKYGRALGAYQVMEANLPQWSQQTLGRTVTPDEFLANPQIQDAIFNAKFGEAVTKYGNPQDAASVWFTGQPLAKGANRRDVLGTTGQAYVDKFNRGLSAGQPVQMAAARQPSMGAQEAGDVLAGGAGPSSTPTPVQRPPMGPSGAMPQATAPQQMAQAPPGADPFGFSRMPPQVAVAVKSLLRNPLPAAQARGMAIVEMYKKTDQWSDPVADASGVQYQINRSTNERKIFQQPQDSYTVETDGRGNMVQVNTRTNQRSILDKAEGWQSFKGEDGNTYAWNPRNPQSQPVVIGKAGGTRTLTTLEERRAYGIADDDKRVVQVKPNNDLVYPSKAQTDLTINNSGQDKFNDTFAADQAKQFGELLSDGVTARADLGRLRQLRTQIDKLPGGFMGGVQNFANQFGVKLSKDAPAIEVANALISQLVPAQRQGLPGAASDRDIQLFRDSLPKLSNTKEGNAIILDTMEGLAVHRQRMASIASKVATKRMTREEAFDALEALPDPFERFKQSQTGETAPRLNTMKPGETITLPGGVKMTVE
jgi:hypothetical protein